MKENQPLLVVENLKKYYDVRGGIIQHTIAHVRAVDDVSFQIISGKTLGLVGESGCGKSTIGRQIVRLEKPTAGNVIYQGKDISHMTEKEIKQYRTKIQMVFQDSYSSLNPRKRVEDILSEPMLYHHLATRKNIEEKVDRLLEMVGLPVNSKGRFPHEFSGGQRQRICIAKALSLEPDMIVCDEPVSALDVSIQAQILNLLKDLQKKLGITILFIGHGLGAVNYVSDYIAVMYLGKLVEYGTASEVFHDPVHPYTKALCAAVPIPDPEKRDMTTMLQGEAKKIPDSNNDQKGCLFAPRCKYRKEECMTIQMDLLPVQSESYHLSACPFANEAYTAGVDFESGEEK